MTSAAAASSEADASPASPSVSKSVEAGRSEVAEDTAAAVAEDLSTSVSSTNKKSKKKKKKKTPKSGAAEVEDAAAKGDGASPVFASPKRRKSPKKSPKSAPVVGATPVVNRSLSFSDAQTPSESSDSPASHQNMVDDFLSPEPKSPKKSPKSAPKKSTTSPKSSSKKSRKSPLRSSPRWKTKSKSPLAKSPLSLERIENSPRLSSKRSPRELREEADEIPELNLDDDGEKEKLSDNSSDTENVESAADEMKTEKVASPVAKTAESESESESEEKEVVTKSAKSPTKEASSESESDILEVVTPGAAEHSEDSDSESDGDGDASEESDSASKLLEDGANTVSVIAELTDALPSTEVSQQGDGVRMAQSGMGLSDSEESDSEGDKLENHGVVEIFGECVRHIVVLCMFCF